MPERTGAISPTGRLRRGIDRIRLPVAIWIAFKIAGATSGTTSSPMPEIQRSVFM